MTRNPVLNALAATVYIALVVSAGYFFAWLDEPDIPFLLPLGFISVFTLSAAVMGYLFLGEPIQLYLEGEKRRGVKLFLQTVGVFAGITVLIILAAVIIGLLSK